MILRVLHIGKYYPPVPGGIEKFLYDFLPALSRQGIKPAILVHEDRKSPYPGGVFDGIAAFHAPSYGTLLYAPLSPRFPQCLQRAIRSFRPDVLHVHVPNTSAFWALALPAARRIPWVVHWHADVVASDIDRRMAVAYQVYRPIEQRLLKRAWRIVATSPAYLQSSPSLRPWLEKCRVIPLGLDPARLPKPSDADRQWAIHQWGGGQPGGRVLSIGRLTYYKGHEYLIEAARQLSHCQIRIVGEGDRMAALQQAIRNRGVSDRVVLMGGLPDTRLHALLDTCDCLCLPSVERTEAFGLVLLEAMRYAKPVIASDVAGSGIGWVIADGESGMLVPPADAEALAGAILQMSTDGKLRRLMSRSALDRFEKRFRIDHVAGKMAAMYHECGIAPKGRCNAQQHERVRSVCVGAAV